MKCNVGRKERIFRTFLGLTILGAGIVFRSWWGTLGLIPLLTAAVGWCPVSRLLGVSTCKEDVHLPADTTAGGSHHPLRFRNVSDDDHRRPTD
jgi:hypothetical protein